LAYVIFMKYHGNNVGMKHHAKHIGILHDLRASY
jgi:hypothetical protein